MLFRIFGGIVAAVLGAAVVLALPGFSPNVEASIPVPVAKANVPERAVGVACSEKAWPYFEAECLRDRTPTANLPRSIRVITPEYAGKK